jgi:AcrR family transcriptional regulator
MNDPISGGPSAERAGLSREAVVARALQIGTAEGLEAVSIRRLAMELGVTPMALYRHVRDKQDLINAMTEVVLEGIGDVAVGADPGMTWVERLRLAFDNYKEQIDARPLALPLSLAYTGDGPPSFWRMLESLLATLLDAGFERREAIVHIRMISILLAGYLMLLRQGPSPDVTLDDRELDLMRRRFALGQLSLPRDEFPNLVESAEDTAEVWLSDPDRWWGNTVDLIVFGLEQLLERKRRAPGSSDDRRRS